MHNPRANRAMTQNQAPARTFQPVPYTQEEYEDIQAMLNKFLGPEYVSTRPGAGNQRVSYIEGWKALNLANEIFGFNGWSSEMINTTVDFIDTHGNSGKILMGLSIVVRITIKDGTYHEDIGYGFIENAKNKAAAFEKCKKEAFTDGLKRCLRCFGNVLGNCLYDKKLLAKLLKVERQETELDDTKLYRDLTFTNRQEKRKENAAAAAATASKSSNAISYAPKATLHAARPSSYNSRTNDNKTKAYVTPAKTNETIDGFDDSYLFSDDLDNDFSQNDGIDDYEMQMILNKTNNQLADKPPSAEPTPIPSQPPNIPAQSLFVSAKKADLVQEGRPITSLPQFDTKFISTTIRRTVDPTRSVPIKRTELSTSQTPSKAPITTPTMPLNPIGKRLLGVPPSQQRPPIKRLHKDIQPEEANQDKENRDQ